MIEITGIVTPESLPPGTFVSAYLTPYLVPTHRN